MSFSVVASGGVTYQWRKGNVNLTNSGGFSGVTTPTLTLNPVNTTDASNLYNLVITGGCAGNYTTANITLAVISSQTVTAAANNQSVCVGNNASITLTTTGVGLVYQWRNGLVNLTNSGNISGVNTATLNFTPAGLPDASTNYNVVITGPCITSFTSSNISLSVNSTQTITTTINNQTVCAGATVNFTVPTGAGLTYQWRNGTVNLVNGGNISGANSSSLIISGVTGTNASTAYNLVITGPCATNYTSANVSLVVNAASTITTSTSDQTACAGSAVTFSVPFNTGLNYQWRKGTVNLTNGANISGVTTNSLTFNPVSITDASSNYNLMISGLCVTDYTSANIALNVITSATITTSISNQTACAGGAVSLSASSITGLNYQWRNGTVNLTNGANVSGATSATLTLNPVSFSDASSNYNLTISGLCAANYTSANISLLVNASPTITAAANDQTVCSGIPVSFSVTAIGSGITYQWRNGTVDLINGGTISGANSNKLNIFPTKVSDASTNYNVIVTALCAANYTSSNITLVVNPSSVTPVNSSFSVCVDKAITFTAQTIDAGTYIWTGPNSYTSSEQNPVISPAAAADAGTYSLTIVKANCLAGLETVTVDVDTCSEFLVPEGFSPNGDDINDFFVIRGIANFPNNKFMVFNRWGEKIFEANPYTNTWDGKATMGVRIAGNDLPVGTYFYVLDLGNGSRFMKGTIYLNR